MTHSKSSLVFTHSGREEKQELVICNWANTYLVLYLQKDLKEALNALQLQCRALAN